MHSSVLLPLITPNSTFEEVAAEITRKREANEANPSFSSTESSADDKALIGGLLSPVVVSHFIRAMQEEEVVRVQRCEFAQLWPETRRVAAFNFEEKVVIETHVGEEEEEEESDTTTTANHANLAFRD